LNGAKVSINNFFLFFFLIEVPKTKPGRGAQQSEVQIIDDGEKETVTIWGEVTFKRPINPSRVTVVTTTVQLEQKAPAWINTSVTEGQKKA
jgi:hypothetical protein